MKKQSTLKTIAVIILIMMISLISFVGIYVKKLNKMENIVPDYKLSMDFAEKRITNLHIDTSSDTIYYDADGNEVEEEAEGGSSKQVPVNQSEVLNSENYRKSKEIMKARMEALGATQYYIRQDENGYMVIELPEEDKTDLYLYAIVQTGLFEIKDAETEEILLTNDAIKNCNVVYNTTEDGTTVYLSVQLDKEGTKKLEEISQKYVKTTDEEGNDTTKNITISVDETTLTRTYFGQTIQNGLLQLPIGSPSTSIQSINSNYEQAKIYEAVLGSGKLPIVYTVGDYQNTVENTYTMELAKIVSIIGIVLLILIIIYFIARYRTDGIMAGISEIGFIASLLLIIRYTNCTVSVDGMVAIAIMGLFQFVFLNTLLRNRKKYLKSSVSDFNETFIKYLKMEIPIDIIACLYTFVAWTPISSMGMILFWGAVLFAIYNIILTKVLITENK